VDRVDVRVSQDTSVIVGGAVNTVGRCELPRSSVIRARYCRDFNIAEPADSLRVRSSHEAGADQSSPDHF